METINDDNITIPKPSDDTENYEDIDDFIFSESSGKPVSER